MNFDFSDELKQLRDEARKFLSGEKARARTRKLLNGEPYDPQLWRAMAELGWTGCTIPEVYGGSGLGHLAVCMLAHEIGHAVAPVPFSSSVYLATEALLLFGTAAQKEHWLPLLAKGDVVGTLALAESTGTLSRDRVQALVRDRKLTGIKMPVPDGPTADFAVVVASDERGNFLHLVDLRSKGIRREEVSSLDQSRPQQRIVFEAANAEALDSPGWNSVRHLLDRAAVMMAFEQIGGAEAALLMARDFALERYAFGKPIGSFQAIKHKLADAYVNVELARSNAYYGAWALNSNSPELPVAAAAARIAASEASWLACKESIQTHGGIGFTWEMDCHFYFRSKG